MVLRRIEIYTKLLERWLEVHSCLQMRDIESFTDTLDVGTEERIRRSEDPLHRSGQLLARCKLVYTNLIKFTRKQLLYECLQSVFGILKYEEFISMHIV